MRATTSRYTSYIVETLYSVGSKIFENIATKLLLDII